MIHFVGAGSGAPDLITVRGKKYLEEAGADVDGMSDEELEDASELFALPDGKYLIVEG